LAKVYETSKAVRIPVIGMGGIMNAEDAVEFLIAGASAVQVGTANFIDPSAGIKIADGITAFCEEHKINDVGTLVGSLDAKTEVSAISSWL
jgi:dihydroorotate dehydrogenase (NAD+) catalytic subunit